MYDTVKYVIDSNVIIEAYKFYYHTDFFREFWDYMKVLVDRQVVFIPPEVALEINRGKDFLSELWLKNLNQMPVNKDVNIFDSVKRVVEDNYVSEKAQQFFQGADPHVIAWAIQLKAYIVTNEQPSGISMEFASINSRFNARVKIPDVIVLLKKEHKDVPKGIIRLWDVIRDMREIFLVKKPYRIGEDVR